MKSINELKTERDRITERIRQMEAKEKYAERKSRDRLRYLSGKVVENLIATSAIRKSDWIQHCKKILKNTSDLDFVIKRIIQIRFIQEPGIPCPDLGNGRLEQYRKAHSTSEGSGSANGDTASGSGGSGGIHPHNSPTPKGPKH